MYFLAVRCWALLSNLLFFITEFSSFISLNLVAFIAFKNLRTSESHLANKSLMSVVKLRNGPVFKKKKMMSDFIQQVTTMNIKEKGIFVGEDCAGYKLRKLKSISYLGHAFAFVELAS